MAVPHGHYKTTTITAALRTTGLTATAFFDGATNGERFRDYITNVLAPVLKPGDIVILDNLGAHKVAGVREAVAAVGARVLYLRPTALTSTRSSRPLPSSRPCCAAQRPARSLTFTPPSSAPGPALPHRSAATTSPQPDTRATWPSLHDRERL